MTKKVKGRFEKSHNIAISADAKKTALKLMRQVEDPKSRHQYRMRSIGSGGETLGQELLAWGQNTMFASSSTIVGKKVDIVCIKCYFYA